MNNKYQPLYFPFHHHHPLGHSQTARLRRQTARGELVRLCIKIGILKIWDYWEIRQWVNGTMGRQDIRVMGQWTDGTRDIQEKR